MSAIIPLLAPFPLALWRWLHADISAYRESVELAERQLRQFARLSLLRRAFTSFITFAGFPPLVSDSDEGGDVWEAVDHTIGQRQTAKTQYLLSPVTSSDEGSDVWEAKATEDSLIAHWLSDLNREVYEFQLVSTDCVSSEHTDITKARKFSNNQVDHVVGPRQTAKTQVTDIPFAKRLKDGGEKAKQSRRRKTVAGGR